jgi:acyl-CoA thioesterase-2
MVEIADVDRQAVEAALADMLRYLTLQPAGARRGAWVGESPEWLGDYVFGGCVIAQAIMAGTRDAPAGTRLHSMHAYFLRPVSSKNSVHYQVDDLRAGRSFTARRLQASQHGRAVLDMSCSFTSDTDGYLYDLPAPERISFPTDLRDEQGPGPWIARFVGPTPPATDGTRQSTHRMWFRIPAELPDDAHLHTALLGFATDWTGVGGRPLHLEGDTQGMISLDHAAWFHRPIRADAWLFYDVQSLVNAGGRGLLRGVIRDPEGRVVISVAQEMRLIPA